MVSGSCLNIDLNPVANVKPTLELTLTWLIPSIDTSTGSSTVIIFLLSVFSSFKIV